MDERTSGRLETTVARARALLGSAASAAGPASFVEGAANPARAPGPADSRLIAARIVSHSNLAADAAQAVAADIVNQAGQALLKLDQRAATLNEAEVLALESVLQVRGRPAVRVLASRLESLERHPGSEFWQEYISLHEERIVGAAAATGAAIVASFSSGNPPWTQGSAWLVARNRVVTNRHVLATSSAEETLVETTQHGTYFRGDNTMTIDFAADDRAPSATIRRRVIRVLYLARQEDPVDIAVLEIEPGEGPTPLVLINPADDLPKNLFVVGHPVPLASVPTAVQAVFDNPDGRKRVSFGKRLEVEGRRGEIAHDASTVGGYSGGPVVRISDGTVVGLHFYGDPIAGNLAITADAIRNHEAYQHLAVGP